MIATTTVDLKRDGMIEGRRNLRFDSGYPISQNFAAPAFSSLSVFVYEHGTWIQKTNRSNYCSNMMISSN